MVKIDAIDRKILLALDTDARASYSHIGKGLRIGKSNVQYRVSRLLKEGVIKKFVVQPSLAKLGLFLGKIYFQLSGYSKAEQGEMLKQLMADKRISWVALCEGRWDLMLGAYVSDMGQFIALKNDIFSKFEKYVASYDVVFLAEGHTSQRTYLVGKKGGFSGKVRGFMSTEKADLSDLDRRMLKFISNNSRFSYSDIAREFKINIKTAKKRVKGLEKAGVIRGYVAFINPKKIGYSLFKLCIYLREYEAKKRQFVEYCLEQPNVVHAIESLGPWEIELEIEAESPDDFYRISHEIRNAHSGIIKKMESVFISDELKLDFLPGWYG